MAKSVLGLRLTDEDRARLLDEGGLLNTDAAVEVARPYQSDTDRALSQGKLGLRSTYEGLGAVANALTGNEAGAVEGLRRKQALDQRSAEIAPRVSEVGDIRGVGDAVEYARNIALSQGPNILASVAGGLGGAAVGRRVGLRMAEKKFAGEVEQEAAQALTKKGAQAATKDVADAQLGEATRQLARQTPGGRVLAGKATQVGAAGGAALASVALETGGLADSLEDKDGVLGSTMQERAGKVLAGGTAAGLVDALPAFRLLNRSGLLGGVAGQEVRALAGKMRTRLAREIGEQAVAEGGTELVQTVIERASRKWIDDRVAMLDEEAFNEYLNATIAGGVLGGLSGGVAMFPKSVSEALRKRPQKSTGSAAGDVANADKLLVEANDTIDLDTDIDNEPDDGSFQLPGQQPSPSPETAAELAQGIPASILRQLRDPRTTPALREALGRKVQSIAERRDQLEADKAARTNQKDTDLIATIMDGDRTAASAITKLFAGKAKTLVDGEITDKANQWHPSQSLLAAVKGRPSLTGEEVASIRALDEKLTDPAMRLRAFERFANVSGASDEDQRAVRADAAKTAGVKIDDRALASTMRADSTARWMQDRTLRSALRDLASDGDAEASDALNELEAQVKQRIGREQSLKHRTTLGDQAYATVRDALKGTPLEQRLQQRLNQSYEGVSVDDAVRQVSRDATAPERELQVVGPDGKESRVDLPHLINLVQANSGAKWGESRVEQAKQAAEAYAKALEVLKTQGDRVANPKAMARDSLLLRRLPDGSKITLGDVRALGYFKTEGLTPDGKTVDPTAIANSDEAIYKEFDPADAGPQEAGAEGDDTRVPGGDTFLPNPKRAIAPQEDVLEAMMGAPPVQANARIAAKTDEKPPREREPSTIDEFKQALEDLNDLELSMTPAQRREAKTLEQRVSLRKGLQRAFKAQAAEKAARNLRKERLANRPVPAGPQPKVEPAVRAQPKVASLTQSEADRRRVEAQGKRAAEKEAANPLNRKVEGKSVADAKKRALPVTGARRQAGEANAARLNAELAQKNAEHAAKRERGEALLNDTQKRMLLGRIKATFPNALAKYEALVDTMTVAEMLSLRARIDKAVRERNDTIDDASKPKERATSIMLRAIDQLSKNSKPASVVQLNHLASQLLDHFGLTDVKMKVQYAPADSSIGFGRVRWENGTAVISLRETMRGADALSTLSHEIGHIIERHAARTASAEQKAALQKAFDAWLKDNPKTKHVYDVMHSRAPAVRQQLFEDLGLLGTGKLVSEASPGMQAYVTLYDEWFADQVARYVTTDAKTVGIVESFFAEVARVLREVAEMFGMRALPDKAMKEYLNSLRPGKASVEMAVRQTETVKTIDPKRLPKGVDPVQAAAAVAAVTSPGTTQSVSTIVETFRRLPTGPKTLLTKILSRGPMITKLRELVKDPVLRDAMDDPRVGMETRMAVAFEAWRAGDLKLPEATGTFRLVWTGVMQTIGVLTETEYFGQFLSDVANSRVGTPERYDVFRRAAHTSNALGQSLAELERYWRGSVLPLADKVFLTGVGERLRAANIPAITDVVVKFKATSGERTDDPGLFPARHREANRLNSSFGRAIEGLDEADLNAVHDVLTNVADEKSLTGPQRKAMAAVREHFDATYAYLQQAGVVFPRKKNYYPIVMKESHELFPQREEFLDFFANNFDAQMRAKLKSIWEKGLKPSNRVDAARIKDIQAQLFGPKKKNSLELAEMFYAMAIGEEAAATPEWVARGNRPSFRYMNEQLMDFVLDAPMDLQRQFAKFREPNLAYTVTRYNEAAAKRAEFQRRFPTVDSLSDAFEEAKKQGATAEQLDLLTDYIDVMMGSYGLGYPPALKAMLGGVDKVFGTKLADNPATMRRLQGFIVVYQNVRLLGLATLSSIVDSFGIAVRTGTFNDAWRAYRDTFKSIRKNGSMEDMWQLAEDLGVVETTATNEALAMAYGGLYLSRGARQVNDFFFKAIGLTRWTQATRVAAVSMANRFLLRHANGKGKHSARYLKELGLQPGDIVADGDFVKLRTGDAARDARLQLAMLRFVDESILRPDPSQRPLWASDPNYMLISQYKSFTYAFQSTILKRIGHEFREGNYQPLLLALAYVPVMLASELLREFIQYGDEGNPNRENWGATEYAAFATKRTGLLGPKEYLTDVLADPQYGRLPGVSFLGPSAAQARDVLTSNKQPNRKLLEATPLSSVTKHHIELDPIESIERSPRGAAETIQ